MHKEVTIVNKNMETNTVDCKNPVKKLVVSDNYLVILFYDRNPVVWYFDYETIRTDNGRGDRREENGYLKAARSAVRTERAGGDFHTVHFSFEIQKCGLDYR